MIERIIERKTGVSCRYVYGIDEEKIRDELDRLQSRYVNFEYTDLIHESCGRHDYTMIIIFTYTEDRYRGVKND